MKFSFLPRRKTEGSWELVGAMTYTDLYSWNSLLGQGNPILFRTHSLQPQDHLGGTKSMHSEGTVLYLEGFS